MNQPNHLHSGDTTVETILSDSDSVLAWIVDVEGVCLYANDLFCRLVHRERDRVIGATLWQLFDAKYANEFHARNLEVIRENKKFKDIELAPLLSGEIGHYITNKFQFNMNGKIAAAGVAFDIENIFGEIKRYQSDINRLAQVAKRTKNAVIMTDAKGKIEWVNEAFTRLTEFTLDEVKGKSPGSMLQGKHSDPITVKKMRDSVSNKEEFDVEIINYSKSGNPYWVEIESKPYHDADGSLLGFMAIEQDLTEKKHLTAQLIQADKLASLGTLAAGVAHEINNPLAILGAEITITEKKLGQTLTRSQSALERIAVIVRGLRNYARTDVDDTIFFPDEAILNSLQFLAPILGKDQIEVTFRNHLKAQVKGSVGKFQQVITNLLTNSRDAILKKDQEFGKVHISIVCSEPDSTHLQIDFIDDGPGIPSDILNKIFDPFFTTKEVGKGTGLGLSISQAIIKDMKGTICVLPSKLGAHFQITLPIFKADQ